jgi:hypothetical protein
MQHKTYFEKQVEAMTTQDLWERFNRNEGTNKSPAGHWEQNVIGMELQERGEFDD